MVPQSERRRCARVHATPKTHCYRVYGLTVESEIELPELVPTIDASPDVCIRYGDVPHTLDNLIGQSSWCIASTTEFVFTIEGVARYYVAKGKTIIVERRLNLSESIPAADIRLWLLGSAFGALLHQRGLLPLHVSAVKAPHGVWAFTGNSGEGKSTLAGFLHRRYGWEIVSDDVSVVDARLKQSFIYPGPRKLKLWSDALKYLGFDTSSSVRDLSNTEKFQLYLPNSPTYESELLSGVVVLDSMPRVDSPCVYELKGLEAFEACLSAIYRPYMDAWFKLPKQRIEEMVHLCRSTKVYRFRRPRSLADFELHLEPLLSVIAEETGEVGEHEISN